MRTVFVSKNSFEEASYKAKQKGYVVVGRARRPNGEFIVFAEAQQIRRYF